MTFTQIVVAKQMSVNFLIKIIWNYFGFERDSSIKRYTNCSFLICVPFLNISNSYS